MRQDQRQPDQPGRKDDQGRDRWDLLPWSATREVVKVVTYGAAKYAPMNWVKVSKDRYYAAAHRHLSAWWLGEKTDTESGLPHLAHAACCILFCLALDLGETK